jgi:hypothetical protein
MNTVNHGIRLLEDEKPDAASYSRVLAAQLPLRQILQTYAQVVSLWRTCVAHAAAMEFGAAAEMIGNIDHMSAAFFSLCEEVRRGWGRWGGRRCCVGVGVLRGEQG